MPDLCKDGDDNVASGLFTRKTERRMCFFFFLATIVTKLSEVQYLWTK